jgi:TolB-like protein
MGKRIAVHRPAFRLLAALILHFLSAPLYCEQDPVLAILPFEAVKVSRDDARAVDSLVENSFASTGVYTVIMAEQKDQILGDQEVSRCTDRNCAVEIGRKLSADQVVLGSVAAADTGYILNAKIIATASSRTLAADSVSAVEADDLERACRTLARSLTKRAVPGSLVEEPIAGGPGGDKPGGAAGRPAGPADAGEAQAGTGEGTGRSPEDSGSGAAQRSAERLGRADLWPLASICGGVFLLELGNVMGSTSFELRRRISDFYLDYDETSWNFGELWKTYDSAYVDYYTTATISYISWSAAVASVPTYLFAFPDRAFRLSRWGIVAFSAGIALSVSGNVLDLAACAQRYRNDFLYQDYMSAGTGQDELWDRYRRGYVVYSVERLTGYAFWLLGGAGMITAFFLPGPKEQPVSGFWDKTFLVGGMGLIGLGSVTRTLALNHRQTHVESGGDETEYDRYVLNSVLSYTLWALGGAGMLLPFLTDIGREEAEEGQEPSPERGRPERLRLLPMCNGVALRLSY